MFNKRLNEFSSDDDIAYELLLTNQEDEPSSMSNSQMLEQLSGWCDAIKLLRPTPGYKHTTITMTWPELIARTVSLIHELRKREGNEINVVLRSRYTELGAQITRELGKSRKRWGEARQHWRPWRTVVGYGTNELFRPAGAIAGISLIVISAGYWVYHHEIQSLHQQLNLNSVQISTASEQHNQDTEKLAALTQQHEQDSAQISATSQQHNQDTEKLAALTQQHEQDSAQISATSQQHNQDTEKLAALTQQHEQDSAQISATSQQHNQDTEKLAALTQQHEQDSAQISATSQQHNQDTEKLAALTQQHEQDSAQISATSQQHNQDTEKLAALTQQHEQDSAQISATSQQHNQDTEKLAALTQQHEQDFAQISATSQQHNQDTEKLAALTQQRKILRRLLVQARNKIKTLEKLEP